MKDCKPKISVIIPNYNHENFLENRIESVLNQTYHNFEIILLDDCSADDSITILNRYKNHPKVSHFEINKQNSGSVFKQWIKGIAIAKGEYIWIAESDDIAHKEFLKETIYFAENNKNLGLVFTQSIEIDAVGNKTGNIFFPKSFKNGDFLFGKTSVSEFLVKKMIITNVSSVLFKTDKLKQIDLEILKSFKNTGDRYTYIQIALKSKAYFLDKTLNYYRNHSLNTTKINVKNNIIYIDRFKIVKELIKEFQDNDIASKNLFEFYLKNVFKFYEVVSFSQNLSIIQKFKLYSNKINFKNIFQLSFQLMIFKIFKNKMPFKIRVYFKKLIYKEFQVKV